MARKAKDLRGLKVGKLTVLKLAESLHDGRKAWLCQCECGNTHIVSAANLTSKRPVKSCGCLLRDLGGIFKLKEDLTGKKFCRLTVLGRSETSSRLWVCKCDCGNVVEVSTHALNAGSTKSCGCFHRESASNRRKVDIKGQRFNRLIAIEPVYSNRDGYTWLFKCDCGNFKEIRNADVVNGKIKSCGCLLREVTGNRVRTHGLSKTRAYKNMIVRNYIQIKNKLDSEWTIEMETLLADMFPRCVVCGCTEKDHIELYNTKLHTDHVQPLSKGNGLKPGNAVRLCNHCNTSKNNKDLSDLPTDWREKIVFASNLFKVEWDKYISQKEIRNNV